MLSLLAAAEVHSPDRSGTRCLLIDQKFKSINKFKWTLLLKVCTRWLIIYMVIHTVAQHHLQKVCLCMRDYKTPNKMHPQSNPPNAKHIQKLFIGLIWAVSPKCNVNSWHKSPPPKNSRLKYSIGCNRPWCCD